MNHTLTRPRLGPDCHVRGRGRNLSKGCRLYGRRMLQMQLILDALQQNGRLNSNRGKVGEFVAVGKERRTTVFAFASVAG